MNPTGLLFLVTVYKSFLEFWCFEKIGQTFSTNMQDINMPWELM